MPAGAITLDRVLTWAYKVRTGTDDHGRAIIETRYRKLWARRGDFVRSLNREDQTPFPDDEIRAEFTCRSEAVRDPGFASSNQKLIENYRGALDPVAVDLTSGIHWNIRDWGPVVERYGGSRDQYLLVRVSRIA